MIWKNDVQMEVINFTANHVLAKVKDVDGFEWYLTGFYGWLEASQKEKSWKLLSHLKDFIDGSWLCIGDFNAFLSSSEKLSQRPPNHGQIEAFRGIGRLWIYVSWKTWGLRVILSHRKTSDLGRQTQRSNLIEQWQLRDGGRNFS